jgi:hypothetical protein
LQGICDVFTMHSVVQAVGALLARGWLLVDNASTVVLFIVKQPRVTVDCDASASGCGPEVSSEC